jgi:hypothetical protein
MFLDFAIENEEEELVGAKKHVLEAIFLNPNLMGILLLFLPAISC